MKNAVKSFVVLGVVAIVATFSFSLFLQNSSGDFLEILKIGKAGVKLVALAFVPLGVYLAYKAS